MHNKYHYINDEKESDTWAPSVTKKFYDFASSPFFIHVLLCNGEKPLFKKCCFSDSKCLQKRLSCAATMEVSIFIFRCKNLSCCKRAVGESQRFLKEMSH